jgi:predicted nucleic acid-binding protein
MNPKVYLETSFISYLTAKLSQNVTTLQRQLSSKRWWADRRHRFDLFVSQTVHEETQQGDSQAARERLGVIEDIPILPLTARTLELATRLVNPGPLPANAFADAIHMAVATVYGCEYLLTWNFKHINNAEIKRQAFRIIEDYGFQPATICTPDELMGFDRERG